MIYIITGLARVRSILRVFSLYMRFCGISVTSLIGTPKRCWLQKTGVYGSIMLKRKWRFDCKQSVSYVPWLKNSKIGKNLTKFNFKI